MSVKFKVLYHWEPEWHKSNFRQDNFVIDVLTMEKEERERLTIEEYCDFIHLLDICTNGESRREEGGLRRWNRKLRKNKTYVTKFGIISLLLVDVEMIS